MENKQHIFSGSTVNEDLMILTIKLARGSTVFSMGASKSRTADVQVLDDCGSVTVLGCNDERTGWITGCISIWDHHLWYFWDRNAVGSQSFCVCQTSLRAPIKLLKAVICNIKTGTEPTKQLFHYNTIFGSI